jgi:hypothetical protein
MTQHSQLSKTIYFAFLSLFVAFSLPIFGATPLLQEKLGVKNINIIKNAKFVTILTMVPEGAKNRYSSIKEVHLNNDEMQRLKTNLLDDHNYEFERVKKCQFLPELSFKFQGDDPEQVVHVFVSPICNQILFGMDNYSVLLNYDPAHERIENFMMQLVTDTKNRNKDNTVR